ncbi:MAG: glycosyltransferase family 9 protein [Bacteroidetes bacterium]|nr:glycosyltransferase family 9 protein [Bacteroidota bacterium]
MKILVRLPNWLGDVVMSTAFLHAVKELYPDARIDVIIKKDLKDIAELITDINIRPFSKQDYKGLRGVLRFGKKLRPEKYDLFFCLPESISSAVMGWATGAKKRVGYAKEGRSFLLTHSYKKAPGQHRVDEYVALLEQFTGQPIADRKVEIKYEKKDKIRLVLVNFNSEAISRRMPADKARRLLDTLCQTFTDLQFGLIGSSKEKNFIDSLAIGTDDKQIVNFAGTTNLAQLAGYMASAEAVLTTDSGPAHLANSLGVPTVVLFGAGDESNTAPYNKDLLTVIRAGKLDCEPCVRNTCKLYGVPKCMELLDELKIVNALKRYLNYA